MKKTSFILAFLLTVASSFTFANGTGRSSGTNRTSEIAATNGVNIADSVKDADIAILTNSNDAADNIGSRVRISFKQDFKNAELISSETNSHFTKLTFRMNDMVLLAFYAENGKLLAIVHNILSSQLPISLMMDLKKNYHGYWITELFELNGKGENAYYISLENADNKLILHSNEDNAWEVYQHTEKK